MNESKLNSFLKRYLAALQTHFVQGPQIGLQAAHELGEHAVDIGLETLEMAKIHKQALGELVLPDMASSKREVMINRAAIFFTEANTLIEKSHRVARIANADLDQLCDTLIKRTEELADSNRALKKGIDQRKDAERSLKVIEDQSNVLLKECHQIEEHLHSMTHKLFSTEEVERLIISHRRNDETSQTSLGYSCLSGAFP